MLLKPYFQNIRLFVQARKAWHVSHVRRVDSECFSNSVFDHLYSDMVFRPSHDMQFRRVPRFFF